jgi:hypothetical protein
VTPFGSLVLHVPAESVRGVDPETVGGDVFVGSATAFAVQIIAATAGAANTRAMRPDIILP